MVATSDKEGGFSECLGMVGPKFLASKDKGEGDALWIPPGLYIGSREDPLPFFACIEELRKMRRPLELYGCPRIRF